MRVVARRMTRRSPELRRESRVVALVRPSGYTGPSFFGPIHESNATGIDQREEVALDCRDEAVADDGDDVAVLLRELGPAFGLVHAERGRNDLLALLEPA